MPPVQNGAEVIFLGFLTSVITSFLAKQSFAAWVKIVEVIGFSIVFAVLKSAFEGTLNFSDLGSNLSQIFLSAIITYVALAKVLGLPFYDWLEKLGPVSDSGNGGDNNPPPVAPPPMVK